MRKYQLFAAVGAALLSTAAQSAPAEYKAVADKPVITLDSKQAYMLIETGYASALTFVRRPDPDDVADYTKRRKEALDKAHGKWVKKHKSWESELALWNKLSKAQKQSLKKPEEPLEPSDTNLAFPALDQENMVSIGPFNRFAKGSDQSLFLHMMRPGRYAFYGSILIANAVTGTCMCMGSFEFELKAGEIGDVGIMVNNWLVEREKAKAEGRALPESDFDIAPELSSFGWQLPVAGAAKDSRLASYKIVPLNLRAAGPFPNYFGVQIDRMTAIPGVLAYDRDRIIDVASQADDPPAVQAESKPVMPAIAPTEQ